MRGIRLLFSAILKDCWSFIRNMGYVQSVAVSRNAFWPPKAIADTGDGLLKILTEIPSSGTYA